MPRRLLVDEAKRTAVVALPQTIEQRFGEGQPKTIIRVFLKFNAVQLPALSRTSRSALLNDQIAVINEVPRSHPIDAEQLVTRLESQLLTDRASLHGGNDCWIRLRAALPGSRAVTATLRRVHSTQRLGTASQFEPATDHQARRSTPNSSR